MGLEERSTYEELIEWLETHDGRMPRTNIFKNGKRVLRHDMTEAELEEVHLYGSLKNSPEYNAYKECKRNTNRRFARKVCTV